MSINMDDNEKMEKNIVNEKQTEHATESITIETCTVSMKGKLTCQLLFCLIVCIAGSSFQVGWYIGVLNTPVLVFKDFYNKTYQYQYNVTLNKITWNGLWSVTNGLLPLGAMFGALGSGYMADYFGRLKALFLINSLVLLSGFLSVFSLVIKSLIPFILGRFVAGILCGLFTGIGPMYLSEIAPRNLRGAAGTLHQLALVTGTLCTNVMGLPTIIGTTQLWPYLFALTLIPALMHVILLPFCVETPKYIYSKKNDPIEAEKTLKILRGSENKEFIMHELEELKAEKCVHENQKLVTFRDLFTQPIYRRPLIIVIVIQIAQQFCGISSLNLYSTKIFINFGLNDNMMAEYATITIDAFKILITLVCMVLIETAGRRKLLLIGYIGLFVSSLSLGITPLLSSELKFWTNYCIISSAVAYVMFYSIGPGPIAWLIGSELFGSNARGKAISIAILVHWVSNLIVSSSVPLLLATIQSYMYILFSSFILFFIVYIYLKVPETKNRKIDEICTFFKD